MKLSHIAIAMASCGFMIPLSFLWFYRWKRNRRNRRAPFTEKFLRSPGQSLNEQIQLLSEDILSIVFTSALLPILIFSLLILVHGIMQIKQLNLLIVLVIIAGAEVLSFVKLWKSLNKRNNLRLGYDGEVAVGQELNQLMLAGYHVFHDMVVDKIRKFNIDHIIVGSSGVYAVETKTRSKSILKKKNESANVIYDGNALNFPHYTDRASVKQARLNAAYLQKWLASAVGEPAAVEAILTIPGWFVERKAPPGGVHVLNPKQIKTFFKSKKERPLSDSMVQRIVHQLDQKCRDIDPVTVQIEKDNKGRV